MASGTFTPTGGSSEYGTTSAPAFTGYLLSGIGTYTLNAQAVDGAGNTGTANTTFQVKYDVQFTEATGQINSGNPANSTGRFKFTVKRQDGTFMFDHTVKVKLLRTSDNTVIVTRTFGTGNINEVVQIDTTPQYQTTFKRGDLGMSSAEQYKLEVWFTDMDSNEVKQAESGPVTF